MGKINSDAEILEFAIAKEMEAYHFLMALAGRVDSDLVRKAFENMAKEELEHKAKLELEVLKTGRTVSTEQTPARPESGYIISDDDVQFDMDYSDMLLLGIEKEDAAFRIYVTMAAKAREEELREMFLALAEEEIKHKIRFQTEYDLLMQEE
ncbi:MAG: ferritin family protein [Planctomycetota bacterium]